MRCEFIGYDDDFVSDAAEPCSNEAEFISCSPITNQPVCRQHKCRCNRTIARVEAERAPTPSSWMAL